MKSNKKDNARSGRGQAVTFTDLPMYPFIYTAQGAEAARQLAKQVAYIDRTETNLALMELISGIAAIQDEEDRHVIAFEVCQQLFDFTEEARTSLQKTVRKYRREALGN
jgi:hypothetical protein